MMICNNFLLCSLKFFSYLIISFKKWWFFNHFSTVIIEKFSNWDSSIRILIYFLFVNCCYTFYLLSLTCQCRFFAWLLLIFQPFDHRFVENELDVDDILILQLSSVNLSVLIPSASDNGISLISVSIIWMTLCSI